MKHFLIFFFLVLNFSCQNNINDFDNKISYLENQLSNLEDQIYNNKLIISELENRINENESSKIR